MIFKQWELVLSGRKTQTRRLWQPDWVGEWKNTLQLGRENPAEWAVEYFCLYKFIQPPTDKRRLAYWLDQLLPVIPKRAQPAIRMEGEIARVKVLKLRSEPLQCINFTDAVAEGCESRDEYITLWQSINGKRKGARWQDNPSVLVIDFQPPQGERAS